MSFPFDMIKCVVVVVNKLEFRIDLINLQLVDCNLEFDSNKLIQTE